MKTLQFSLVLFLSCLLMNAQTAVNTGIPEVVKTHMQQRVDAEINVGIAIAYINGDQVDYYSVGTTDLSKKTPIDNESVFEIGSISKTFTGILLADQILNGSMSLSDPISKYLPSEVKVPSRNGKQITIKDIVTHSSGLARMPDNFTPADPSNPYKDYSVEQMYEFISNYELPRDIGESYEYSNLAMGLLGHILSLHTGKNYEDLMIEKITQPLHMADTRVIFTDRMKMHLAMGHSGVKQVSNWDIPTLAGAGGIRSTTKDMVTYIKANLGMIDVPISKAMTLSHEVLYENGDTDIAMAWHEMQSDGVTYLNHGGGTGGYNTFVVFIKGSKKGAVVLSNGTEDISSIGMRLLNETVPLKTPKKSISTVVQSEIESNDLQTAITKARDLHKNQRSDYDFDESALNALGYSYLQEGETATALELFKLNVEFHPKASNPYDSLAEAYLKAGDSTQAKFNYKKSLELNPGNSNAVDYLKKLGVDTSDLVKTVKLSTQELQTYIGKYQLAPNFIISVTVEDDRLIAQATGQPKNEIFASEKDTFYLKVVEAKITFNREDTGIVESLTLFQNGQEMNAAKVKE